MDDHPEIHDEVLVTFIYGNINNAIVVGALYNGIDTPFTPTKTARTTCAYFVSLRSSRHV